MKVLKAVSLHDSLTMAAKSMRTKYFVFACVSAAAATLGSCSHATAPNPVLEAARRKWEQGRPVAYAITIGHNCECTLEMSGPVVVAVRGGTVESRTYVPSAYFADGTPVPSAYANLFPSVDGLFDRIDDAYRRKAPSVDVVYDPVLGFPVDIYIDYVIATADDELRYHVTNFQTR